MIAGAIKALIQSLILYFQDRRKVKREAGSENNETVVSHAVENIDASELGAPTTQSISTPPLQKDKRKQNAHNSILPAMTVILCILFLGIGIAGGYYYRDSQANDELDSYFEAGRRQGVIETLSELSDSNAKQYNAGNAAGYSSGWNNGFKEGFKQGAYYALDELDPNARDYHTGFGELLITYAAKESLANCVP